MEKKTPISPVSDVAIPNKPNVNEKPSWMNEILVCMKPVFSLLGKSTTAYNRNEETWEIPFELISDIEWLGSGAQGAVFSGKLFNEVVAVKKVKDVRETDIKHLRKLNHDNIVKFRGVCTMPPVYAIVMEFCPYGPLHEALKEGSKGKYQQNHSSSQLILTIKI
jgi:mitogen-activated protein kinase kinase kinase 13